VDFMNFRLPWIASLSLILLASSSLGAADLGQYREFQLGASTADVVTAARADTRDVKTLHERPALLQELSWRPRYASGQNSTDRDSVNQIVFSFVDNQLFKMAIEYDRNRTEGLTKDDLIASLSEIYGPRSPLPTPPARRSDYEGLDTQTTVARWSQADTTVSLQTTAYGGGFGLVITSTSREALARKAQATAVTMDAREAPRREAERARLAADAARAAAEKTRTTNKATFQP
jgi:hypothetical protein